jgi:hypothetical protein
MSTDFTAQFKRLVPQYLGRPWSPRDGVEVDRLSHAERRLGHPLPAVLHALYGTVGALEELCLVHNRLLSPDELVLAEDHLIFMEENQGVVSWGVRAADLQRADPEAWQRNNARPIAWFSEEKTVSNLFASMLAWYAEIGVWG